MMLDEGFVFNQLEHLEVCLCKDHSYNQLVRLLKSSSNLQGLRLFYMDVSLFDNFFGVIHSLVLVNFFCLISSDSLYSKKGLLESTNHCS